MFTRQLPMLIVSMAIVVLPSCGGGGGGGGLAPAPPAPPNPAALPITAANAPDITATVLEAIISTVEVVDIVDVIGLPPIGGANNGITKPRVRDTFTEILVCDSGEATITWNDADDDLMISTGDTFDTVFDMCFFADSGVTLDGSTSFTNMIVTGDPISQIVPWRLAISFGFENLSATDSEGMSIIDGDLTLDMSSADPVVVNLSIVANSLTAEQSGTSETLSEYMLTETIDLNLMTQVIGSSGNLTSSLLEGTVTFETLQDFMVIGDDNPSSGQMLIRDSSSGVLVTVLGNINVQLDIDLDLDGMVDETIVVTWTELDIS